MGSFYNELSLEDDPFYTNPVGYREEDAKGFINRDEQLRELERFMQKKSGSLIIIGDVGVGKSSFLKRAHYLALKSNKVIFEIDVEKFSDNVAFLNELMDKIKSSFEKDKLKINKGAKESLKEKLMDLEIEEMTDGQSESKSDKADIGADIKILGIKKTVEKKKTSAEDKKLFISKRLERIKKFMGAVSDCLDEISVILIADNLDKLDENKFEHFISNVVKLIPHNILFLTSGNIGQLKKQETVKIVKETFHLPLYFPSIKTADELTTFVNGRITNYSFENKPRISFGEPIYGALLERTNGNLRNVFQYLSKFLLKSNPAEIVDKPVINKGAIISVIKEYDQFMKDALEDRDFELLGLLSDYGELDLYSMFDKIKERSKLEKTSLILNGNKEKAVEFLRKRCDSLYCSGWIFRNKGITASTGRSNKTIYSITPIVGEILELK